MTDLVIRPGTNALRYAGGKVEALRFLFEDIEKSAHSPALVRELAKRGRGMMISAKVTIDDAVDDAVADAIAAGSRRAKTPEAVECEASQSGAKRIAHD